MKKLAVPIFVFSVLGLVSLFLPNERGSMFSVFLEFDRFRLFLMLAAFGLPAIMSVLVIAKPAKSWHAMVALAGFAVATVKAEAWSMAGHLGSSPLSFKLQFAAILGGVICTILAVAKQEEAAAAS
jgi:hypothetical protein